ncbi:MAG TPA: hypothetical protein DCG69_10855 [Bacteroidales bacterium]|nr:hypothetical protein [Bacteroidales bacterium]
MPRPKRHRRLQNPPAGFGFHPMRRNWEGEQAVQLFFDEYEAIRLTDYLGLDQENAAIEMNISRPTFTRIYEDARRKMAKALVDNLPLKVAGGNVSFEHQWFRCLLCDTTFRETERNNGETCPVCSSAKIEHINLTLGQTIPASNQKSGLGEFGFCVCPACGNKKEHTAGVPCKSLVCEKCHVNYVRENSGHHLALKSLKNKKN